MKRKILACTVVLLVAFSSVSFAAVSSSKSKSFSAPRPSTGSTTVKPSSPQTAPDSGYKPSAPSSSYSDKAPASQNKPGVSQPVPQQPQSGGFWRNAGIFGSGMLLGGMLGHMFGFGNSGFFASLMGMIINVLFLLALIAAGRWVWNYFKNKDRDKREERR